MKHPQRNKTVEGFDLSWYERNKVAPPEHIPYLTDEELQNKFREIRGATQHGDWVQQGNRLTCQKCPQRHSDTIPVDYLLTGTDANGYPMLTKIQ